MSISKVLADVLRADIVSIPASSYVLAYPTIFNAASAVPPAYYTCLRDLWITGTDLKPSLWSKYIVDSYGYGDSGTRTIDIVPTRILDAVDGPEGFNTVNTYGAKFAEIYVLFKIGGNLSASDVDRITQSELRIQRLIDYNYRCNLLQQPEIQVLPPSNIDPNADLKAYWQGFKAPINDKEIGACYYASYTDLYLK